MLLTISSIMVGWSIISKFEERKNSHESIIGVVGHYGTATRQTKGAVQQVRAVAKSRQHRKRAFSIHPHHILSNPKSLLCFLPILPANVCCTLMVFVQV